DLKVKVGDRVSEGKVILVLDAETAGDGKAAKPAGGNGAPAGPAAATAAPAPRPAEKAAPPVPAEKAAPPASAEKAAPAREAPAPAAPPAAAPAAALAHQEDLGSESRPQLGDDPARHAVRRSGHHRPRGAAGGGQQGERERRDQADPARVPDEGVRRRTPEVPRVQRLARRREPG